LFRFKFELAQPKKKTCPRRFTNNKRYCGGIYMMPKGWPPQRMRSMRKMEAETRSRGRILSVKRMKEKKGTLLLLTVARTEIAI
jgi:hypothetical protein